MFYKIENDILTCEIDDMGAQLHSLKSKENGTEYLWQGDPRYWPDRATNIFPYVARLTNETYTLRVANNTTPSECSTQGFSQTACGFVVEFVDIITTMKMRDTNTNVSGYPATLVYDYLKNTLYSQLPSDLQTVIKPTPSILLTK